MASALLTACADTPAPLDKIQFDLARLDAHGLEGPPGGKRSLSYEFCTPNTPEARAEVTAADPSVRFSCSSPGRVGCGPGECLSLGDSYQRDHRRRVLALAALPYVRRIEESFFE
jgi:hypothetical protein